MRPLGRKDRSIDLCVLRDACHELFCVIGDFYASGTQDAELRYLQYHLLTDSYQLASRDLKGCEHYSIVQ